MPPFTVSWFNSISSTGEELARREHTFTRYHQMRAGDQMQTEAPEQ